MRLSRRSGQDRTLNRLTTILARLRQDDRPWLDLTQSNPTQAGIAYPADRILAALADPAGLVYDPHPFGSARARAAVAAELSEDAPVDAERVVLTAGTSEAYGFLFKLLCDPGDEVLVPCPSYPLLETLAFLDGVRLVPYPLRWDGEWHLDLGALRRAVTPRTRAVMAISPNNPTGSYLGPEERDAVMSLGLPLVCDEVFLRFPVERLAAVSSALAATEGLVFVLGGLSKLAALPQMKLGWIAVSGTPSLVAESLARLEHVADAFLSVSTPVQAALPTLLETAAFARDQIRLRLLQNLGRARSAVHSASPLSLLPVEGGWYAVMRLPQTRDEEAWATGLLEEEGVLVQPGYFYDFPDQAWLVVSLLTDPAVFAEGFERLVRHVDRA